MRERSRLPFLAVPMILMSFVASEAAAQNLCSGRCRVDPKTFDVSCGLSLFGHVMCVDLSTGCAEFGCQSLTPASKIAPVATAPVAPAPDPGSAFGPVVVARLTGRT